MSRKCVLSGKGALTGNRVSHANNKTKMKQRPNLSVRRYYIEALKREVKLKLAKSTIRTIDKIGIDAYIKSKGINPASLV